MEEDESQSMHLKLYRDIGDQLPRNSQEFKSFKQAIPLCPRDRETHGDSAEELLGVWERQGEISVGKYAELIRLLRSTNLHQVLEMAKAQISQIMDQLMIENRMAAGLMEAAPGPPKDDISSDNPVNDDSLKNPGVNVVRGEDESQWMHRELYRVIGNQLPRNNQEFKSFKQAIPLLKPRDKENHGDSAEALLDMWERRGGISVGKYANLLKLLRSINLIKVLEMANAKIIQIMDQLKIENDIAVSPVETAPDPPNDPVDDDPPSDDPPNDDPPNDDSTFDPENGSSFTSTPSYIS